MQKWPMTLKRYVIQNLDLYKRFFSKENIDTAMTFQFPKLGKYRLMEIICICKRAKITRDENKPVYSNFVEMPYLLLHCFPNGKVTIFWIYLF